ncbi:MAG: CBS domain-containing protein [Parafilimonas sp.]
MLASEIIQTDFPQLNLTDEVDVALQLMDELEVQHLPVINEERFAGIISKNDLLHFEKSLPLSSLQHELIHSSVYFQHHFLSALKLASELNLSLVPVVNEANELIGCISYRQMILKLSHFLNTEEPGGIIVLETQKHNFSFGEISRLIETNDAYITQLNTSADELSGLLTVTIKINKTEISDIIATLQRYEYSIKYYFGAEHYENEIKENYDLLMAYLRM